MKCQIACGALLVLASACGDSSESVTPEPGAGATTTTTSSASHGGGGNSNTGGASQGGADNGGTSQGGNATGGTHQGGSDTGGASQGGNGTDGNSRGYVSGTRLRARYYQGADGSKAFLGLYDSQLGVNCYFTTAADGSTRCLPTLAAASASPGYFTNSSCTQAAAIAIKTACFTGAYAVSYVSGAGCPATTLATVWSVGAPSATLYVDSGGTCTDYTASYAPSYDFFIRGAEVPASTFVEGTEEVE